MARLLLHAESVVSSRIEGLVVGGRRLLRADVARQLGEEVRDVTAAAVLANIDAMAWGVSITGSEKPLGVETLLETHWRLLAGSRMERYGEPVRVIQNWPGGNGFNPCSADFVPPPLEDVRWLLDDLGTFCNGDTLPPSA